MADARRPFTSLDEVAEVFPNLERVETAGIFMSDDYPHLNRFDFQEVGVVGISRNGDSARAAFIFVQIPGTGIIAATPRNFLGGQAFLRELGL